MKGLKVPRARFLSDTPVDPPPQLDGDDVVDVAENGFDVLLARLPPDVAAAVRLDAVRPVVHVGVGRELEAHRVAVHVDGFGLLDAGWSWFSNLVVAAAGGFGQRHTLAELEAALEPSFVVRSNEDGELFVLGDHAAAGVPPHARTFRVANGDRTGDLILRVGSPPRELVVAAREARLNARPATLSGRMFSAARAAVSPNMLVVELHARQLTPPGAAPPCFTIATDPTSPPERGFDPGSLSLAPTPDAARAALRLGSPPDFLIRGLRRSFNPLGLSELTLDLLTQARPVAHAIEAALRPARFGAAYLSLDPTLGATPKTLRALLDAPFRLSGALLCPPNESPRSLRLALDPWP